MPKDSLSSNTINIIGFYYLQEFITLFLCQLLTNYVVFNRVFKIKNKTVKDSNLLDDDLVH